jgi:hypothetical protein
MSVCSAALYKPIPMMEIGMTATMKKAAKNLREIFSLN